MKRKLMTLSTVALIAGTAAFAQNVESGLNQEVYAKGMADLTAEGYDVNTVRQGRDGNLTFMASSDAGGRILILDADGMVVSDTMTQMEMGVDQYAATTIFTDEEIEDSDDTNVSNQTTEILPEEGSIDPDIDIDLNTRTEAGGGAEATNDLEESASADAETESDTEVKNSTN
ncbi:MULTISPECIES: hypothetical protein [Maritimibacter]|jgi:hypothetical protein|uniref:Uncharacterized protein n=1 Tax=Maritimibacter alkaliphilus HTCC2654 TaxID=314271 RepID=A3V9I4_9RHOB|nr:MULTISPECIES: hypothetical protein [Maritimibacter]EAQ14575.1 hypothetical protein RB2654_18368 [Maritimibacter alkaliphilus HTCC2654]MBL6426972.1 hypothetical protein [Maritimibacter sp.]TYP82253.1 hypothetical protein BD830_104133 [Maritimibacter alkaliphilus HTCC2654]